VADAVARPWVEDLSIDVIDYWGRESLFVSHPEAPGC